MLDYSSSPLFCFNWVQRFFTADWAHFVTQSLQNKIRIIFRIVQLFIERSRLGLKRMIQALINHQKPTPLLDLEKTEAKDNNIMFMTLKGKGPTSQQTEAKFV